jgi:hypothetical protein
MSDYLNFSIQTRKDLANWVFRQLRISICTNRITSRTYR